MKSQKLLKKLKLFMSAEQREQVAQRDSLKKLLKKLRKRRDILKEALETAGSKSDRQRILEEMRILKVHRQKGLALLQQLQSPRVAEKTRGGLEPGRSDGKPGAMAKTPRLAIVPNRSARPGDTGLALRERAYRWPWRVA